MSEQVKVYKLKHDHMGLITEKDFVKLSDHTRIVAEKDKEIAELTYWRDEAKKWNKTLSADVMLLKRKLEKCVYQRNVALSRLTLGPLPHYEANEAKTKWDAELEAIKE